MKRAPGKIPEGFRELAGDESLDQSKGDRWAFRQHDETWTPVSKWNDGMASDAPDRQYIRPTTTEK